MSERLMTEDGWFIIQLDASSTSFFEEVTEGPCKVYSVHLLNTGGSAEWSVRLFDRFDVPNDGTNPTVDEDFKLISYLNPEQAGVGAWDFIPALEFSTGLSIHAPSDTSRRLTLTGELM